LIRIAAGRFDVVGGGRAVDVGSGNTVGVDVGLAGGISACKVEATIVETASGAGEGVPRTPQASDARINTEMVPRNGSTFPDIIFSPCSTNSNGLLMIIILSVLHRVQCRPC
jgi:hypothetical protein